MADRDLVVVILLVVGGIALLGGYVWAKFRDIENTKKRRMQRKRERYLAMYGNRVHNGGTWVLRPTQDGREAELSLSFDEPKPAELKYNQQRKIVMKPRRRKWWKVKLPWMG